jgi:hypothetical protein
MKKLLALTFLSVVLFSSCSKDDESPSYTKADFIGKWQMTETTSQDYNPDDCTNYKRFYEFSETEFTDSNECDGATGSFSIDYAYNGKNTISYTFFVEAKLVIAELTETTLKLDEYVSGTKLGTSTFEKVP